MAVASSATAPPVASEAVRRSKRRSKWPRGGSGPSRVDLGLPSPTKGTFNDTRTVTCNHRQFDHEVDGEVDGEFDGKKPRRSKPTRSRANLPHAIRDRELPNRSMRSPHSEPATTATPACGRTASQLNRLMENRQWHQ